MYCAKCGSENPDDARFCGGCGAAIAASDPAPPRVLPVVDSGAPAEAVSPGLKWGILAASLLIPLIGIGMGLYYWVKGGSEEKAAVGRLWFFVALAFGLFYTLLGSGEL